MPAFGSPTLKISHPTWLASCFPCPIYFALGEWTPTLALTRSQTPW
jgi:hypothetical protein